MRFRSRPSAAGQIFAVAGVNTVSFAVVASAATRDGLLGFAVERIDPEADERYYMSGFKVFRSVVPMPVAGERQQVSTFEHPVQSFVWDDFTARPDHEYRYVFHPLKGRARNLDRRSSPLSIRVRTEPLYSEGEHDIFFNRGVASSQAYTRNFGTQPIASLRPTVRERALAWLSRDLDDALLRFVDQCEAGDRLLCCFYEFRYRPFADRLVAALGRGVDVQLIVDGKVNERTDKEGVFHPSYPRVDNLALLAEIGFPPDRVHLREARKSYIQHNKFMVRVAGGSGSGSGSPTEVWTGSTNMSPGGIAGQTNVGHWLRNPAVAERFRQYWELLATDPGGRVGDTRSEVTLRNKQLRVAVEALSPVPPDLRAVPRGTTTVFSPRQGTSVLSSYAALIDTAERHGCVTLAFGIGAPFKRLLADNTPDDGIVFLLLEKKDRPDPRNPGAFVRINASNNVYKAWGSFLRDPVYQWARETNAGLLGLNQHVSYIHSKFMLIDPLSADPLVVTGSANFSEASVQDNDENMLVIRGSRRVADIYLTEFNRLFNHYYFRSVTESLGSGSGSGSLSSRGSSDGSLFLVEDASWQEKYAPGTLRAKRLRLFAEMAGFSR
jgi:phosphatidylserine/phosphatidylglycerophosphate/cardiolipin synthase-like enzyme